MSLGSALLLALLLTEPAAAPLPPPEHDIHFDRAEVCSTCHASSPRARAMRDAQGRSVAPFDLWQGTMMANAARDPLWRAVVSAEVAATPARREEIEAKCLRCHSPMASLQAGFEGRRLGIDVLEDPGPFGLLARDGASCLACHQISEENLGTEASFTGHPSVGHEQLAFGPHADPFAMPMRMHSNFTPVKSDHVLSSELCATCHTLVTDTLESDGRATGQRFLEQAPYLEWRNSRFASSGRPDDTCAGCHLPTTDLDGDPIRAAIARNPGGRDFPPIGPRSPYGRHLLVGGNTLVPALLRDHAEELGVEAPRRAFEATLESARRQLAEQTAELEIESLAWSQGRVRGSLRVRNLCGHSFPTGHPARRAFLHVVLRDAKGKIVFESGRHDERGRLIDVEGRALPAELAGGPALPHLQALKSESDVQVYESLMADSHGGLTSSLLRAARWQKNNRLLPEGWSPKHPDAAASRPSGVGDDRDFLGGGDRLLLDLPAGGGAPGWTLEVELLYQTLSPRYLAELLEHDTEEVRRLERMLRTADLRPVVVARAGGSVGAAAETR